MRTFEQTYVLESGPVAQSFEEYERVASVEYRRLLDSDPPEGELQSFIERNPCFAPKSSPRGSEYPIFGALISQPILPGLRSKVPDFLLMTWNSSYWYPNFIEIEKPSKKLFKQGAIPTYQFTEARNQLAQWRVWLSDPVNVQKFVSDYGIPDRHIRFRTMRPRFILVYGRRVEFESDSERSRQRAALMPAEDESLVSCDGLSADDRLGSIVTARATGSGRYRALGVMPTLRLGPSSVEEFLKFDELDDVVAAEDRISPERRSFLRKRIPYWKEWMSGARGVIHSGDFE